MFNRLKKKAKKHSPDKNTIHTKKPWTLEDFPVAPAEGKTRFQDLDLPLPLLHGLADLGFEYCTPIQAQTLPNTLCGNDTTGKAQTGTGKSAAFLITIITNILEDPIDEPRRKGSPRGLVIAPTRELALQIAEDCKALTKYCNINTVTLVGGIDYQKQQTQLADSEVDIIVATPGRLLDFCSQRLVNLKELETLVIDEADRMLSMGFIPDVRRIIYNSSNRNVRQTLLFSATFSDAVLQLSEQWTVEPQMVEIEPDKVAVSSVNQITYLTEASQKYTLLFNLLNGSSLTRAMIFANRRDQVRALEDKLYRHGFKSAMLTGEIPQQKRIKTLDAFKEGEIQILVATDVAGRGIHVKDVSHVINYNLPEDLEDYVHRIGRTGRAGATGTSISFACEDDAFLLPDLEQLLGEKLPLLQPPSELLITPPDFIRASRQRFKPQDKNRRGGSGSNRPRRQHH